MSTFALKRDPARTRAACRAAALMTIAMIGLAGCSSRYESNYRESPWRKNENVRSGNFSTASIGTNSRRAAFANTGVAAWDGDISSPGMTAAHPSLPLGSWVRVTNTATAAATTVRVTRRMSSGFGRDIELSRDAAAAVGALQSGTTVVMIEPLDPRTTAGFDRAAPAPAPRVATAPTGLAYDPNLSTSSIRTSSAPTPVAATPVATTTRSGLPRGSYLQVGSFRNASYAWRMKGRVERERIGTGLYGGAHVVQVLINGVAYHRVMLGPIASSTDGQRALRDARALGHNDARLIRN